MSLYAIVDILHTPGDVSSYKGIEIRIGDEDHIIFNTGDPKTDESNAYGWMLGIGYSGLVKTTPNFSRYVKDAGIELFSRPFESDSGSHVYFDSPWRDRGRA